MEPAIDDRAVASLRACQPFLATVAAAGTFRSCPPTATEVQLLSRLAGMFHRARAGDRSWLVRISLAAGIGPDELLVVHRILDNWENDSLS